MAIEFRCSNCGQGLRVPDEAAGKRGTCPKCGEKFVAPAAGGFRLPEGTVERLDVAHASSAGAEQPQSAPGTSVEKKLRRATPRWRSIALVGGGGAAGLVCGAVVAYFLFQALSQETPPTGPGNVASATAPATATSTPSEPTHNAPADSSSAKRPNSVPPSRATPAAGDQPPSATARASDAPGTTPQPSQPVKPAPEVPNNGENPSGVTPPDPARPPVPMPEKPPTDIAPPDDPARDEANNPVSNPSGNKPAPEPAEIEAEKPVSPAANQPTGDKPGDPAKAPPREPSAPKGAKAGGKKEPKAPVMAFAEDGTCLYCLGLQFVPLTSPKPYVHVEGEKPPRPETCVPWRPCPHCQKDRDRKELVDAETARLATSLEGHKSWEERTGRLYTRVETRHATIHSQLSSDATKRQGAAVEELAAHLQKLTRSILLTQSRPDKLDILIHADGAAHARFLEKAAGFPEFTGTTDWLFVSTLGGFTGEKTIVFNAGKFKDVPAENVTLSYFAGYNMRLATEHKSRDWLTAGFQYYCEHAITKKNRVYTMSYKATEPPLGQDWNVEAKKALGAKRKRDFEQMFRVGLADYMAADHVQAYSMVSFLLTTEPRQFLRLVQHVAAGQTDPEAVEGAYGKPLKELEGAWVKWAMGQP
jgi:hypothetical protein